MIRRMSIVLAVAFAASACVRQRPFVSPQLSTGPRPIEYRHNGELFQLNNGMKVVMLPDANTNLVKVDVRYRVGSSDDPAGKPGLAHLVEHMLFEARPDGTDGATIGQQLSQVSLYQNAHTTLDETHYTTTALSDHVDTVVTAEARRLATTCDQLDEATFERERNVVGNELHQRDSVATRAYALLLANAYGAQHPHAHLPIGDESSIAGMTLADVCAFIDAQYQPRRAILVVSGNIDIEKLRETIGASFGPLANISGENVKAVQPLPRSAPPQTVELPVDEATAYIAVPIPSFGSAGATRERVLRSLLALAVDDLENDASLGVTHTAVGQIGSLRSPFAVVALSVSDGAKLDAAVDAFFDARDAFVEELTSDAGGPDSTLEKRMRARMNRHRAELIGSVEPLLRRGDVFADYLQYSTHHEFIIRDLQLLEQTNLAALQADVRDYFQVSDARLLYVMPSASESAVSDRATISFSGTDYDLDDWSLPIDESEAARTLAVPDKRWRREVSETTLSNGMKVILAPGFSHPLIDVRLVFPVGSLHEPASKPGVASLAASRLEHDYSRTYPIDDVRTIEYIGEMGGAITTDVSGETTVFRITGLSGFADGLIWKLHWLLHNGVHDGASFAKVRAYAKQIDTEADRSVHANAQIVAAAVYGADHPYARPGVSAHSLQSITTDDLSSFSRGRYGAGGATLIVTGQFDPDAVLRQIKRLWGRWGPYRPRRLAEIPPAVERTTTVFFAVEDADAPQVSIDIRIALPNGTRDLATRLVLEEVLSQRLASLRERLGATYGVQVRITSHTGPGLLSIAGDVDSARAADVYSAIADEIAAVRNGERLKAAFVRGRRAVMQRLLADSADSAATATELETSARRGLGISFYEDTTRAVARLSIGDLQAALQSYVSLDRAVVVVSGPRDAAKAVLEAAGAKQPRWL